jgi:hypothetical protein
MLTNKIKEDRHIPRLVVIDFDKHLYKRYKGKHNTDSVEFPNGVLTKEEIETLRVRPAEICPPTDDQVA